MVIPIVFFSFRSKHIFEGFQVNFQLETKFLSSHRGFSSWLTWLKLHPALVVVSGPLFWRANALCPLYCSLFCANLRRPGRLQSKSSPSSALEGDRDGKNRGCELRRQFFVVWSLHMRWTWSSLLNCLTRTLFRMVCYTAVFWLGRHLRLDLCVLCQRFDATA